MKIAVFGLGYVGAVTAVSLASNGHEVWGVDKDLTKVDWTSRGIAPVREPGLEKMLADALSAQRLHVTPRADAAVPFTDAAMVCVGTPTSHSGTTDLSFVLEVIRQIGNCIRDAPKSYMVLLRSTVPPGTTKQIVLPRLEESSGMTVGDSLKLYFHPEFMREGSALADSQHPALTVIGAPPECEAVGLDTLKEIYGDVDGPLLVLNYQEAELLKLACNGFHALKVAFANEIGALSGRFQADPQRVMSAFVLDTKLNISDAYLTPGFAFGGSCLLKDVRALTGSAVEKGLELPVCESILPSNDSHLDRLAASVVASNHQRVGIIGIAFKSGTDDVRESAALRLARRLSSAGKDVLVYEPEIALERLIGANLRYLTEMLPDYADRLVDWQTISSEADVLLVTRSGVVSPKELDAVELPVMDATRLS